MATTPPKSMQITMATDSFIDRQPCDSTVKYPFDPASLTLAPGGAPHHLMVRLGNESLTFDECMELFDAIRTRLREQGVKPTDELDIQYCCIMSEAGATKAQFIFTYPV